jgi:hypothetical protein
VDPGKWAPMLCTKKIRDVLFMDKRPGSENSIDRVKQQCHIRHVLEAEDPFHGDGNISQRSVWV